MKTKLIALVTATAISLTGLSAAPTQASEADNIVKFIVGAAVIGALVNAANQPRQRVVTRRYVPAPVVEPVRRYRPVPVAPTRHIVRARGHKPNRCLFQKWTPRGWKRFYGRKCMVRRGWEKDNRGWFQRRVAYW